MDRAGAVASARLNVEHNLPAALPRAHFMVNNCLDGVAVGSVDRILCNPPFHQLQAITARARRESSTTT